MSVIFYCVSGEGMGHATRSEVTIRHLLKRHKLVIFSYQRAFNYLKTAFEGNANVLELVEIIGFNFVYEKNELKQKETILSEYKKIPPFFSSNFKVYENKILRHSPSIIITDFEPASAMVGRLLKIPVIAIDNQGFVSRCEIEKNFRRHPQVKLARMVSTLATYSFVISFFNVPVMKKYRRNTFLIGPMIRKKIFDAVPSQKGHFLVYQTSTSNEEMFGILKSADARFIVYGFNKEVIEGNVQFKKPSVDEFIDDLASCRGVITNGGFSLICEAVYLQKPVYSIPVKKQIEQEINGYYLLKSGIGMTSKTINSIDLKQFMENYPGYKKNLERMELEVNNYSLLEQKISLIEQSQILQDRKKDIEDIYQAETESKEEATAIG